MPNHCWNWVEFEGSKTALEKLHKDLEEGLNKADGWLEKLANHLLDEDNHYETIIELADAFGTKWWDIDRNTLDGEVLIVGGSSAWSPPTHLVAKITKKYNLKAVMEFEECGNDFGGTETYENGEMIEQNVMRYNEWVYFNDRNYAMERIIEDVKDNPDYFIDLDDLERELHYMSDNDVYVIKQVYQTTKEKQLN